MYKQLVNNLSQQNVKLVAVSKTKPQSAIQDLYDDGQRIFGENRVQELVEKHEALPKDISWHMIGALQKNKVKYIAPFIDLIHSVDSLSLAKVINKEAAKNDRVINVLLQLKIAQEDSKSGYKDEALEHDILTIMGLENLCVQGVMGMGTFTSDASITRQEFKQLKTYFDYYKSKFFDQDENFSELSMGMSGDYKIAVEEGTTMVRIGSLLFGSRY